jgi:hypothetical protein
LSSGICLGQESFVDGVELTTIKAPWVIRILGQDLDVTQVKTKANEQSAYFMMVSDRDRLNVSVFIEPIDKCKTSEQCRDFILMNGNPGWGKFQDLAQGKIKDFSYFEFYRPETQGKPVKMLDMYAEFVSDGYWVDLHISKVLYKKEDHRLFEDVVNSMRFVPKNDTTDVAFAGQKAMAEKATNSWLGLWDNKKCGESFLAMSSITRAENTKASWVDYCAKVNGTLGPKKTRTLIASAYTRSLLPKTERPLAIQAYQTNFANRPAVVEVVGLLLEKEGNWTVSNYMPE